MFWESGELKEGNDSIIDNNYEQIEVFPFLLKGGVHE